MKIAANRADAFARNPDEGVRAVLVYGPDDGLVRARGDALTKAVVEDPADPFRIAEVSAAGLRDAPSLIAARNCGNGAAASMLSARQRRSAGAVRKAAGQACSGASCCTRTSTSESSSDSVGR